MGYVSFIQEILLILAMLVGGVWALFKYGISNSNSISLEVEFDSKQERIPNDSSYYIHTLISIKNVGGAAYRIFWGNSPPFSVTPVNIMPNGRQEYEEASYYSITTAVANENQGRPLVGNIEMTGIGAGNSRNVNFVSRVTDPGLYLLKINIPIVEQKTKVFGIPITIHGGANMIEQRFFFVHGS